MRQVFWLVVLLQEMAVRLLVLEIAQPPILLQKQGVDRSVRTEICVIQLFVGDDSDKRTPIIGGRCFGQ